MSRKKIKNPLIKRIPKEIIGDWKKYLVVFLFLVLTIGFVSGMYVANDSMLTSADEGVSKYKQEDGHFELKDKADSELVTAIESGEVKTAPDEKDSDSSKTPVTLYENFYRNETEDYDADGKKDGKPNAAGRAQHSPPLSRCGHSYPRLDGTCLRRPMCILPAHVRLSK